MKFLVEMERNALKVFTSLVSAVLRTHSVLRLRSNPFCLLLGFARLNKCRLFMIDGLSPDSIHTEP